MGYYARVPLPGGGLVALDSESVYIFGRSSVYQGDALDESDVADIVGDDNDK